MMPTSNINMSVGAGRIDDDGKKFLNVNGRGWTVAIPERLRDRASNGQCRLCMRAQAQNRLLVSNREGQRVHPECAMDALRMSLDESPSPRLAGGRSALRDSHGEVALVLKPSDLEKSSVAPDPKVADGDDQPNRGVKVDAKLMFHALYWRGIMLKGHEGDKHVRWFTPAYGPKIGAELQGCQDQRKKLLLEALNFGESMTLYHLLTDYLGPDERYTIDVFGRGATDITRAACAKRAVVLDPDSTISLSNLQAVLQPGESLTLADGTELTRKKIAQRLDAVDLEQLDYNSVANAISRARARGDRTVMDKQGRTHGLTKIALKYLETRGAMKSAFAQSLVADAMAAEGLNQVQLNGLSHSRLSFRMKAVENGNPREYRALLSLADEMPERKSLSLTMFGRGRLLSKLDMYIFAFQALYTRDALNKQEGNSGVDWAPFIRPILAHQQVNSDQVWIPVDQNRAVKPSDLRAFLRDGQRQLPALQSTPNRTIPNAGGYQQRITLLGQSVHDVNEARDAVEYGNPLYDVAAAQTGGPVANLSNVPQIKPKKSTVRGLRNMIGGRR